MNRLIDKRVLIIGKKHPWCGEIGRVKDIKTTAFGKTGYVIDLENGSSCFVFNQEELKIF